MDSLERNEKDGRRERRRKREGGVEDEEWGALVSASEKETASVITVF